MVNTFINLYEATFPINLVKDLKSIEGLENLGNLEEKIKINFRIKKILTNSFIIQGDIKATFQSECQRCSKVSPVVLAIKSKVHIKDKSKEGLDLKSPYEIHYQNLQSFNIDIFVREEIYLNFPSIFLCCVTESYKKDNINHERKVQPLKKIKDLMK